MYVYIYICILIHINIYLRTYIHTYIYKLIFTYYTYPRPDQPLPEWLHFDAATLSLAGRPSQAGPTCFFGLAYHGTSGLLKGGGLGVRGFLDPATTLYYTPNTHY